MNSSPVNLCLIGGSGRSGTTLLREIFSHHPSVAVSDTETRFLIDPDGIVDFYDSMRMGWSPYLFDSKVRRLERLLKDVGRTSFVGRLMKGARPKQSKSAQEGTSNTTMLRRFLSPTWLQKIHTNDMISRGLPRYPTVDLSSIDPYFADRAARLIDSLVLFSFEGRWTGSLRGQESSLLFGGPWEVEALTSLLSEFCREVLATACLTQRATHFVEDSPLNILSFDRVLTILPESRLIHIHRDPRDVVASYMQMRWSPSDPVQAAHMYSGIMRQWDKVRAEIPDRSFVDIPLHALVENPAVPLARICDHWGLEWHDRLLEVDVSHSHSGRWKREIDRPALKEVEDILAPYIARYGVEA